MARAADRFAGESTVAYRAVRALFAAIAWPCARIHTERSGVADQEQVAVVICNHRSMFDFAMGLVAFRRFGRFPRVVVRSNYFDRRLAGWALRQAGAIPLDRQNLEDYYRRAKAVLDAGMPIVIMPEGRLSGTPGDPTSLGQFKYGAARLAAKCDAPVWALAHVGTDTVWPRDAVAPRVRPFRRPLVVLLGAKEVVTMSGDEHADSEMLEQLTRDLLVEAVALHTDLS